MKVKNFKKNDRFSQGMLRMSTKPSSALFAVVSTGLIGTVTSLIISGSFMVQGQLGLNPIPTTEEVIATYIARIPARSSPRG
jgi:hypothetical protein